MRAGDSLEDLRRKVRVAATIGTWQSTMLHWLQGGPGLRPHWRHNTVEERLLGVSMTGAPPSGNPAGILWDPEHTGLGPFW